MSGTNVSPPAPEKVLEQEPTDQTATSLLDEAGQIGRRFCEAAEGSTEIHAFSFAGGPRIESMDSYQGLPGVAMLLANLARALDSDQMLDFAERSMVLPRRILRECNLFVGGAWQGRGGILYSLLHLWAITHKDVFLQEALQAAEAFTVVESDQKLDIVSGSAGLIRVLLELHRIAQSPKVLDVAVRCGDHLMKRRIPLTHGYGWLTIAKAPLIGYAHGASGIASSMLHLADITGDQRYAETALLGLRHERHMCALTKTSSGNAYAGQGMGTIASWCHGAGGIAISRLTLPSAFRALVDQDEIEPALQAVMAGKRSTDCLCHGTLGDVDLLLAAGSALQSCDLREQALARASQALRESKESISWRVPSPLPGQQSYGLMSGLAGVAYGLLRASCDFVPSLLGFEAIGL
jgi:lantibiotic modifying enzyme